MNNQLPSPLNDHLFEFEEEWRTWKQETGSPPSLAARWQTARAQGLTFRDEEWERFWYHLLYTEIFQRKKKQLEPLLQAHNGLEIGQVSGYRLLRVLGWGGMGVVFKAEQTELRRAVAFKVMLPAKENDPDDPNARERFQREAQLAARITNEHVVVIHAVSKKTDAVPFIAMQYLEGQSLKRRLEDTGKMGWGEVVRIGLGIAKGLQAAHKQGLIHRDLKPENLFLESPDDRVKILDFGLARPIQDDDGLTKPGVILCTPAYMAPEQTSGKKVDAL